MGRGRGMVVLSRAERRTRWTFSFSQPVSPWRRRTQDILQPCPMGFHPSEACAAILYQAQESTLCLQPGRMTPHSPEPTRFRSRYAMCQGPGVIFLLPEMPAKAYPSQWIFTNKKLLPS